MDANTKKFPKDTMQKVLLRKCAKGYSIVLNAPSDHSRWSVGYDLIFREPGQPEGEAWYCGYSRGATESQGESPFEYDDEVEAIRVLLVEKTIRVWTNAETGGVVSLPAQS